MHELLEKYIGKDCTIHTLDGNSATGNVTSIKDGWLVLSTKQDSTQVLNLDYIIRIREKKMK